MPAADADRVWARFADGLIGGIHHALNNRVAAVSAVAQVLEVQASIPEPLRRTFADELQRMRGAVSVLGAVPRGEEAPPEPVRLQDELATALELYRLHPRLRDVPCSRDETADVLPVWIERSVLGRALLITLAAAAQGAGADGIRVGCSGDERQVTLDVRRSGDLVPDPGDRAGADAVAAWLGPFEGAVLSWGPDRYAFSLPTLPHARR